MAQDWFGTGFGKKGGITSLVLLGLAIVWIAHITYPTWGAKLSQLLHGRR